MPQSSFYYSRILPVGDNSSSLPLTHLAVCHREGSFADLEEQILKAARTHFRIPQEQALMLDLPSDVTDQELVATLTQLLLPDVFLGQGARVWWLSAEHGESS